MRKASIYTQPIQQSIRVRGEQINYFTKPGASDWIRPSPAALLLAEHFEGRANENILLINSGQAALPVSLAVQAPQADIWVMDTSFVGQHMAELSLARVGMDTVHIRRGIEMPQEWEKTFDQVLLCLAKGRKLARRHLLAARLLLKPNGSLLISGENDLGIKTILKDAAGIFDQVSILGYKKGCRIARACQSEQKADLPDWALQPGVRPGTWFEVTVDTPTGYYRLLSLPGVFSYDRLDEGTELLLANLNVLAGKRVLDLGCGYGIIGLSAAARGATQVDMLDDNLLAVAAAKENAARLNYTNVSVLASDVCSELKSRQYDIVLSNPPFHRGGQVDYDVARAFIQQSAQVLRPGGCLLIVANQFIPYDEVMRTYFTNVACKARNPRYRILEGIQ
jgi:16S rRNA (guanine1207-N2)-methyltransferase